MGSFNEVCALSNLSIGYGVPVKLLFLTKNPYTYNNEKRGCYHYDQWFVRTPPISGIYNDYGFCKFDENITSDIIVNCFQDDLIERPFGFNKYHEQNVLKGQNINHYLEAAKQGRLLVKDAYKDASNRDKLPDNFPTWEKIHELLEKNNLNLQTGDKDGFNAVPVISGVVCIIYFSYDNKKERFLKKAAKVIEQYYDCKIVFENDLCLMVTVKGGFENPSLLCDIDKTKRILDIHPLILRFVESSKLSVLTVMIRADVWKLYCEVQYEEDTYWKLKSVDEIKEELNESISKMQSTLCKDAALFPLMSNCIGSYTIPFMTTPITHLIHCLEKNITITQELIQGIAELTRVEMVMAKLCQSWQIPSFGSQEEEKELKTKILSGTLDLL